MKFNLTIAVVPNGKDPCKTDVEFEGDLDGAKTYIKLVAKDNFDWATVTRTDELQSGDVNRWLISRNLYTGELRAAPFSIHDVDPIINLNLFRNAFEKNPQMSKITSLLGGGAF